MTSLPLLTMGDPAGVGPELCCRLAQHFGAEKIAVVGHRAVLQRVAQHCQLPLPGIIEDISAIPEITLTTEAIAAVQPGSFDQTTGTLAWHSVLRGIDLVQQGAYTSLVTTPLNKSALQAAGCPFPGHTEILGDRCGQRPTAMWMHAPELNVILSTCHIPLRDVPEQLTSQRIVDVALWFRDAWQRWHGEPPRLAMLGLNPHAGEHGLLGNDEQTLIEPAIASLRQHGLDVSDPIPPDTAFVPSMRQRYDGHICHYHDQGLTPFKTLYFDCGVNCTLNLPIVRTSVDHGTAGDIAWTNTADPASLIAAWQLAQNLQQANSNLTQ